MIIENDSSLAIQESRRCAIIAKIWEKSYCFVHVRRSANMLAHDLSKVCTRDDVMSECWDLLPASICNPDACLN